MNHFEQLAKETIDSQGQFEQNGRSNVLQHEYPTVIYNRVPKTGSTAFTQIAYKLVKGKWYSISICVKSPREL